MSQHDSGGTEQMSVVTEAAAPAAAAQTAEPKAVPLRRNVNFQLLWTGSACAFVGLAAADIAYPLVILAITRSPFQAGLFATVQIIAQMLFLLPIGRLLDQRDRRRMLLLGEGVRALAAAGVALAYYLDALTVWQLLGTAAVLGGAQPFSSARTLLTREVVPNEQLTAALTQEQVRDHGSELIGPPLGGALFAVSRALPFLFAAAMMTASFLCALFVKVPAGKKADTTATAPSQPDTAGASGSGEKADDGVLAGIKGIVRNPLMRATALTLGLVNMVGYPLYLCLIVLLQGQHAGSQAIGFVVGAMAMGGLVGTTLVKPLHRAFQPGWLLIAACTCFTASVLGLSVANGPWAAGALLFASGLTVPAAIVMIDILILRQVPNEQRGRTNAALQVFMGLGMPVGLLIAGSALQCFSPRTTLLGLGAGMGAALAYAASQRALREARWPGAAPSSPDAAAAQTA